MKKEYRIAPCSGIAVSVKKGQTITITDIEGGQVADFFAETEGDPRESLSPGATIDCNESLNLKTGDRIYSDRYRPMFRIIRDDVCRHDLIHPCCRPEMYEYFYGNGYGHPNCLDNINGALNEHRPAITPVNLFMNTEIRPDGSIAVKKPASKAGDKIVLEAETDVIAAVAACSVSESDCNGGKCTAIGITIEDLSDGESEKRMEFFPRREE